MFSLLFLKLFFFTFLSASLAVGGYFLHTKVFAKKSEEKIENSIVKVKN